GGRSARARDARPASPARGLHALGHAGAILRPPRLSGLTHLHAEEAGDRHPEEHRAVLEAADARGAVGARAIADRDVDHAQRELGRREEELEVAEGVEVAEGLAPLHEPLIVAP